jgi:hypothetical protein
MPELSEAELAARYGWSMAVLNSEPSLKNLFQRAVAETWAPDRFAAELRSTPWYQANGEAMRQSETLRAADPATWEQRVANQVANVTVMGAQMGAYLTDAIVRQIAESSLRYGWNDNNLRNALGSYVGYAGGQLHGQAQQYENELRSYAASMGVRVSDDTITGYVRNAVQGISTIEGAKGAIQNMAESAFPHLAERFNNGETLAQIAEPYKQSMSRLLELNPSQVDLFDPTVRKALAAPDKEGRPTLQTVYDFELGVRNDSRWLKTKNAQDEAMGVVNRVLTDFGIR